MKREILFNLLSVHYATATVYAILTGARRPKYDVQHFLYKKHGIPFTVWKDIESLKTYMREV